jgi:hypothetical protein
MENVWLRKLVSSKWIRDQSEVNIPMLIHSAWLRGVKFRVRCAVGATVSIGLDIFRDCEFTFCQVFVISSAKTRVRILFSTRQCNSSQRE